MKFLNAHNGKIEERKVVGLWRSNKNHNKVVPAFELDSRVISKICHSLNPIIKTQNGLVLSVVSVGPVVYKEHLDAGFYKAFGGEIWRFEPMSESEVIEQLPSDGDLTMFPNHDMIALDLPKLSA